MKRIINLTFFIILNLISCTIKNHIYLQNKVALQDNFWINQHSVQIIVEQKSLNKNIPLTDQREQSCMFAYKKSLRKLHRLYPQLRKIQVKNKIHYSMYIQDGGCKQIIHFTAPFLKNKIQ